jgi:acetoin utilization deacetylase AcuC-like enzyme
MRVGPAGALVRALKVSAAASAAQRPARQTLVLFHPDMELHGSSAHPEQPARHSGALAALRKAGSELVVLEKCAPCEREDLLAVHDAEVLARMDAATAQLATLGGLGEVYLDGDTPVNEHSRRAAWLAAGAACQAIDAVADGRARNAFCLVRPPGHHASRTASSGFCVFNNVAVALRRARRRGLQRVAVLDWDVHHGNGTQAILWDDPEALFISTHQIPLYPGSGYASERGAWGNNVLNLPLAPGAGSEEFREALREQALPALRAFRPQLVLVSAGFDSHAQDPLGGLGLSEADFAYATHEIMRIADEFAHGRVVSVLEGGYNLDALSRCVVAHVAALASAKSEQTASSL